MIAARCALLAVASAAVLLAGPAWSQAARAEAAPLVLPEDDDAGLDARLAGLRAGACASDEALCRELEAFAAARPPCFHEGDQLTVGRAYIIAADGAVRPLEYLALEVQRVRDVTLVRMQQVFSENAEEKRAAEDLVQSLRGGAVDPANALYRYLVGREQEVPELLGRQEGRSLVVRREGPSLYLRQAGKLLYAALPDAVVGGTARSDRMEGLVFAVLPAPASCQ